MMKQTDPDRKRPSAAEPRNSSGAPSHDFTMGLALFDYIPVWFFAFAVLFLAAGWPLRAADSPVPADPSAPPVSLAARYVANPAALAASRTGHTVFCLGALVAIFAGFAKATWKLLLVLKAQGGAKRVSQKTVDFLGARFFPRQLCGLLLMAASFLIARRAFRWSAIGALLVRFPAVLFVVLFAVCFLATGYVRAKTFDRLSARSNWLAEILNCGMQASFLGLVLSLLAA